jgi:C4-dicarboxylate-binding protein DctP
MAQAPIVIKFSHVVAADTPKGKASELFAKRAG